MSATISVLPRFRSGQERGGAPAGSAPADFEASLPQMTDAELAAMEFEPWPRDPKPGPSHDQWEKWNNIHGAALRVGCAIMQQDKTSLIETCGKLDDSEWESLNATLDHSIKFFSDMADILRGARARLMVATAVCAQQEIAS